MRLTFLSLLVLQLTKSQDLTQSNILRANSLLGKEPDCQRCEDLLKDALEENQRLKNDIECLNETLQNDITDLKNGLAENKAAISSINIDTDNIKMELNILEEVNN